MRRARPIELSQDARERAVAGTERRASAATRAYDDGVLFLSGEHLERVLDAAEAIHRRERGQAERVRAGQTLREQLRFADFLRERARKPGYTLREHLERHGGAIEV